jgi:hypothetical protein
MVNSSVSMAIEEGKVDNSLEKEEYRKQVKISVPLQKSLPSGVITLFASVSPKIPHESRKLLTFHKIYELRTPQWLLRDLERSIETVTTPSSPLA